MSIAAIGTYRPVWQLGSSRVAGPDEDVLTMAVAAATSALSGSSADVSRIVIVCAAPDILEGFGSGVVLRALGLADTVPVELRVGAAPASVEATLEAAHGTLIIAVDYGAAAASAAAALVVDGPGVELLAVSRSTGSLPMRVRHLDSTTSNFYPDARVEREMATVPLLSKLGGQGQPYVAGLPPKDAQKLGAAKGSVLDTGAAASLFLLAELAEQPAKQRLVAVDAASGVGVDVRTTGDVRISRDERAAIPAEKRPVNRSPDTVIPFAMPAYSRAFEAKVGMTAAQCVCGEVSFPPRMVCLACDRYGETTPVELARTGEVYTAVMVHVPIPGIAGKYTLAIVSIDNSPVRVLARVTDQVPSEVAIGSRGRLVLRRIAELEGVPDYGYALQVDTMEDNA